MVNELTTSREESGARSDYPEARRKKTIVNRRSSEYNAKLFGFAELGRDSTMSESKLSPLCSLLPRLSIVEREGGKPKVNRRTSECRALVSSCLGKRPEVERRVDSSWTSQAAKPSGEILGKFLLRQATRGRAESGKFLDEPSGRSATKETLATAGTQESRAESLETVLKLIVEKVWKS